MCIVPVGGKIPGFDEGIYSLHNIIYALRRQSPDMNRDTYLIIWRDSGTKPQRGKSFVTEMINKLISHKLKLLHLNKEYGVTVMWKILIAYPSVCISKGKPSACLYFTNAKILNNNLKSIPQTLQATFAPVQRASRSLHAPHSSSHQLDHKTL